MADIVRIANCSGFYGDRLDAAREMVEGGPIDVLTGDYLAELTMSILYGQKQARGEACRLCRDLPETARGRGAPLPRTRDQDRHQRRRSQSGKHGGRSRENPREARV